MFCAAVARGRHNLMEALSFRIGATGESPLYRGFGEMGAELRLQHRTHLVVSLQLSNLASNYILTLPLFAILQRN